MTGYIPAPGHQLVPQNVKMVDGTETQVLTQAEAEYYVNSRDAYLNETKFTENTDLRDLDRLLVLELMVFRWQQWLFSGYTYEADFVENTRQLVEQIQKYSTEVNRIKDSMGLNKKARDAAAADGNFAQWLSDVKARAKAFGVHREEQLKVALVLMNDLSFIVGTYDRADEEERRKIGFESEADIVGWVRDTMLPDYKVVDEHFRHSAQRYWVKDM